MTLSALQRAHSAALRAVRRIRQRVVTFRRGLISIEISGAVRGSTDWGNEALDGGVNIQDRSVDWLIPADQLVSAGVFWKPQRDDVIVSDGVEFRVMPFGADDQLWRWHDREGQTVLRVFTKERA